MISIARLAAKPDTAIFYLEAIANDRDDHYFASGEVSGHRLGSGSALLSLDGEVMPEDLRAILDGLAPRTGEALVGYRKNRGCPARRPWAMSLRRCVRRKGGSL
ncbi:MAG TPA: relaxase domain-containing protein [Acidimicrobiales bacterium]|nr:relaxase domain-containing protein [Acidimicrobiales bacterium]